MATVKQKFTGDANELLREMERMNKQYIQLEQKIKRAGEKGESSGKKTSNGFGLATIKAETFLRSLSGMATQYLALDTIVNSVTKSIQEQIEVADAARDKNISIAQSERAVARNIGDVSTKDLKKFLGEVQGLRDELKTGSVIPLNQAASSILSATGGDQQKTLAILRSAAPLMLDDPSRLGQFGGSVGDIMNSTGIRDSEKVSSLMLNVMSKSRIENFSAFKEFSKSVAGNAAFTKGDKEENFRDAASLFAVLGGQLADPEGAVTKTASIAVAEKLRTMFPKFDNTKDRLLALQNAKQEKRNLFMESGIERQAKGAVEKLIKGDLNGEFFNTRRSIFSDNAALQRKRELMTSATSSIQVAAIKEEVDSSLERFDQNNSAAAVRSEVREILKETLRRTNNDVVDRAFGNFKMFGFDTSSADPTGIRPARRMLNQQLGMNRRNASITDEEQRERNEKLIMEQLEVLKRIEQRFSVPSTNNHDERD